MVSARQTVHVCLLATLFVQSAYARGAMPKKALPDAGDLGKSDATFVHLFEWKWNDIAKECEQVLGPKGYEAVQVSPPTEHVSGSEWWTRYQPVTYELTSRSGSESQFAAMVSRCKSAGVAVYVDAVINHGAGGSGEGIAGSKYGGREYPMYGKEDFHHDAGNLNSNCYINNYADKDNVQKCDLHGMPDICTECAHPREVVKAYLEKLIRVGVKGIRVDAAKHMDAEALGGMLAPVQGKLYIFQEVIQGWGEPIFASQYTPYGTVTEFGYWYRLNDVVNDMVTNNNWDMVGRINSIGPATGLLASDKAVVFIDNHDNQRENHAWSPLSYKTGASYSMAVAFMLAHPYGYPRVMSSYAFNDFNQGPPSKSVYTRSGSRCSDSGPYICEHRRPEIANMVAWRKTAGTEPVSSFQYLTSEVFAFCRGAKACLVMNYKEGQSWSGQVQLTLPAGTYCDVSKSDDTSSCPTITVNSGKKATLTLPAMSTAALHLGKKPSSFLMQKLFGNGSSAIREL